MTEDPIRVLVVDDTVIYRRIVSDALADCPDIEVIGTAANGRIALQKIDQLHPDVLTLDIEMPEMDGLEVLRQIRQRGNQVGAIMLSGATEAGARLTVAALELGAFDFVLKPNGSSQEGNMERLRHQLHPRIKACARTRQVHQILHGGAVSARPASRVAALPRQETVQAIGHKGSVAVGERDVVCVGISTGGPAALTRLIPALPADLAAPVLIVQHMPPVFTESLARDLDKRSALQVCEAQDGQPVSRGVVTIAPGGKQMKVVYDQGQPVIRVTDDPPENSCRPSVDYLFRSVSEAYGSRALGIIMTGMGFDGVEGCRVLKRHGAAILAQDEESCVVYGMPRVPIESGVADVVASLDKIAGEIIRLVGRGARTCR